MLGISTILDPKCLSFQNYIEDQAIQILSFSLRNTDYNVDARTHTMSIEKLGRSYEVSRLMKSS